MTATEYSEYPRPEMNDARRYLTVDLFKRKRSTLRSIDSFSKNLHDWA